MAFVNITINGQAISCPAGTTVLKAARDAGIDIPTLCDHPALAAAGACRICVVEIQGQRNLQTACTFPVAEGMDIQTESQRVVSARKLILDMLFSERNHFCPYCEASGNCELQSLGYRYGIDHWVYLTYLKRFPLDATHPQLLREQNRCILCGRCIRACSDLVANHTLGLRGRGAESMVHADANNRWGDSSCISCGTCLQVCPTGAIFEKRCAFMGPDKVTEHVKSACGQCSIGCGMEIVTRGGNVLRIKGDWEAEVNGGLLCRMGRFDPFQEKRQRISEPLARQKGKLESIGWKDAIKTAAKQVSGGQLGALASSYCTNEALYAANKICQELNAPNAGMLNQATIRPAGIGEGSLSDILKGDLLLVIGADPVNDQPVASFLVKRAVDKGVRLIVIDDKENGLSPFAFKTIASADIKQALEMAERAEHPVILYGADMDENAISALKGLKANASFIALAPGVNTYAAQTLGFNNGFNPAGTNCLYILLGEESLKDEESLLKKIDKDTFVILQTAYASPLMNRADLVLPSAIWSERSGSLTNTDGRIQKVNKAVEPAGEAKPDWEILSLLAEKLGKKLGKSLDVLSSSAAEAITERRNRNGKS